MRLKSVTLQRRMSSSSGSSLAQRVQPSTVSVGEMSYRERSRRTKRPMGHAVAGAWAVEMALSSANCKSLCRDSSYEMNID